MNSHLFCIMRFTLFLAISLTLLGTGCRHDKAYRKKHTVSRSFTLQSQEPATTQFVIENKGQKNAVFTIRLNDGFYLSETDIVEEVQKMPDEYPNEPLERKAWRFVSAKIKFSKPLTDENWIHSPQLMINSVGNGFCDDLSSALSLLWRKQGYNSRVWSLGGHVVPEVFTNNAWHMYDPLYQVYYYNNKNVIAGVEELAKNPELITQLNNLPPIKNQSVVAYALAHSQKTALLYATDTNNTVNNWFDKDITTPVSDFTIPGGATLKFPDSREANMPADCNHFSPTYTLLSLHIVSKHNTAAGIPLIVHSIEGKGNIRLDNKEFEINSQELNTYLKNNIVLGKNLVFSGTTVNATVYFLVNGRTINTQKNNHLFLQGNNLDSVFATIAGNGYTPQTDPYATILDSIIRGRYARFDHNIDTNGIVTDFNKQPLTRTNLLSRAIEFAERDVQGTATQKAEYAKMLNTKINSLLQKIPEGPKEAKLFKALSDPHVFIIFLTYLEYCNEETIMELIMS